MNYIQLVQRLARECGVAGIGPATVTNQLGEAYRLVNWINEAWVEIQGLHDTWGWMRQPFSFQAYKGVGDYTPDGPDGVGAGIPDLRYWHKNTLRTWRTALGISDEMWLVEWEYQVLRDTYRFNQNRILEARPMVFAVKPNAKVLMLGPLPEDTYTVVGEYQQLPSDLLADTDTPGLPTHLHMIIVYKAMMSYALFESAPEVLQRAQIQYQRLLNQLEREQLQEVYLGNPLA
jgi:hypothetical protein